MTEPQSRYSKEEFARRGTELYERQIRQLVETDHSGEVVAIDIETGVFAVGEDTLRASRRLRARRPHAQTWFVRVGHRGVHRFGSTQPCIPKIMNGIVNVECEATLSLTIRGANGQDEVIEAVIDTGFSGFLTLPLSLISALALPWRGREQAVLGDGSLHLFDVYEAEVIWNDPEQAGRG